MENLEPKSRREYFLNKIAEAVSGEGGGSGGGIPGNHLVVNVTITTSGTDAIFTFDKTAKDVFDAFTKNGVVTVMQVDSQTFYTSFAGVSIDDTGYDFILVSGERFHADGENDYPSRISLSYVGGDNNL